MAICRRLEGLPLALELAAARIAVLSPSALLSRLSGRLALLTGGARDTDERHQTLKNTIEWSYDLLEAPDQLLFRRLAVFVDGCRLDGEWPRAASHRYADGALGRLGLDADPAAVGGDDGDVGIGELFEEPRADTAIERGRVVYARYGCAMCHGADGKGGFKNPNSETDRLRMMM